jgi:GT2 family glycosyltransferase
MTLVTVSILNYRAAALTVACQESLEKAGRFAAADCEERVWVLDNGSGEDDRLHLEQAVAGREWLRLLANVENTGFAAGHNRNLREIFAACEPDFVWLLNNDCLVEEACISALLECSKQHPSVAIWGATLLDRDGSTVQCAGGCYFSDWLTTYSQFGRGKHSKTLEEVRPQPFDYIAGASMWMPAGTLTGELLPAPLHPGRPAPPAQTWLNESFFLYFEELDLARRLRYGQRLGWCRDAVIVHRMRSLSGGRNRRRLAEYHADLSALKFTWLHQRSKLEFVFAARLVLKLAKHLVTLRWYLLPCPLRAGRDFLRWRSP